MSGQTSPDRRGVRPHVVWAFITLVFFIASALGVGYIHHMVSTRDPERPASLQTSALVGAGVGGIAALSVGGFGFAIIFGAIYREPPRRPGMFQPAVTPPGEPGEGETDPADSRDTPPPAPDQRP
ncbi:MAG: hypothetical protein EA376_04750 [Phycisphaeraceae bacterium]|nr:MAG: hypothetical protein EA376_04750 [Phycisphaeraceae bacterium]